jgi:hypothetical protein
LRGAVPVVDRGQGLPRELGIRGGFVPAHSTTGEHRLLARFPAFLDDSPAQLAEGNTNVEEGRAADMLSILIDRQVILHVYLRALGLGSD